MFDIITFGSAIEDTFLRLNKSNYKVIKNSSISGFSSESSFCFPLGSKMFIDDLKVSSGGGGTNTAATFSRQGLNTAYMGKVGDDEEGERIIKELKDFQLDTNLIKKDPEYPTSFSAILSSAELERTVLTYKGACHFLKKDDIPWEKIEKTKWFYISSLGGESHKVFEDLINFAVKYDIKVAVNLGRTQLKLGEKKLAPILKKIDVLILNKEEAAFLTGIEKVQEIKTLKKILNLMEKGLVVISKGDEGSTASNEKNYFRAGIHRVSVVEKTGAGDAFSSGFVAGLIKENSIEYALKLGTFNAASCIQEIGAKKGLLNEINGEGELPEIRIEKRELA